ncbi:MAG: phosphatase PAP2 family protein [Salinivirgaceae bacterium]|nr:phosphatase PAP2 family protein [Salinivirgaceae bacterium]
MNRFFKIISLLFHPLWIPTIICILLCHYSMMSAFYHGIVGWALCLRVFMLTAVSPLIAMVVLKTFGYISSYDMPNRKERIIPLLLTVLLYSISLIYFWRDRQIMILQIMIGVTLSVVITTIVTHFTKISIHAVGMGGLLSVLATELYWISNIFNASVILILIAGLVCTARLYLKAHTPRQVWWGFALGFSTVFITSHTFFIICLS